jgi:HlyD family secretion protein
MNPKVDLSQLAVRRDAPPAEVPAARPAAWRRRLLTLVVLPAVLLAGFAALLGYAAREVLSPPREVTVIPVITSQAALDAPPDTPLFRAAGWVEPRPTPTVVTAMAEGVVERLLVVEGQQVKKGDVVARLVTADAELALEAAEADVLLREGELASAQAARTGARDRHDYPVHLKAELAEAEAALARLESDEANLPNLLKSARARSAFAQRDYDTNRRSGGAVSENAVAKARSDLDAASASIDELRSREKRLPVEIAALKEKRDALKEKLKRKIDETRQLGEATAGVRIAEARLKQANAMRGAAKLRLQRMVIRAPADGRVLALVARPGTRLNGMIASSLQDSSTVLTLYDPASLQVRVDVRLDDVGKVIAGQKVRIETAALAGTSLEGQVLLATSQADVQKNTLSVKVAISNPPATLRPEMLCQVTFLSPPRPAANAPKGAEPYRMLVPKQVIDSSGGAALWVVDQVSGTARRRPVELGLTAGDLVEVTSGLSPSDKVIVAGREGLKEGARVRVAGEDEALGITPPAGGKKR